MENKKLANLFKLSHKISLYVPTRDRNNKPVDKKVINNMLDLTAKTFSEVNGGATSTQALGYWKTLEGKLIKEKVTIVFSYCENLEIAIEKAIEIGEKLKIMSNQEAISLEVNNEIYFI